jgi:hypothetical protein
MDNVNPQQIEADDDLRKICLEIVIKGRTAAGWDQNECYDIFTAGPYEGGYDATEHKFLFSYYAPDGKECWIGFDLEVATRIASGEQHFLEIHKAES